MIKYIEQLLQGQLVEWKSLGEVAEIQKGKQLNKTELTEVGRYPAYNGGVSYSGFTETYNYPANTIIVSQGGASAGYVNFVETEFYANAHCYVVLPNEEVLTRRFAYHYLKMKQGELMGRQIGAGIPGLSTKVLLALLIPIPPLSVQAEIVRILDSFTSLTAELEAELEARRAQYAHYRDELLDFSRAGRGEVVYRPLGEVATFYNGLTGKTRSDFLQGDANYVPYKTVFRGNAVDLSRVESVCVSSGERQNKLAYGDVLFTSSSESLEEVGLSSVVMEEPAQPTYLNSFCFGVRFLPGMGIQPGYAKYMFRSEGLRRQIKKTASGVTRINISKALFKKIVIPIPPLEEQERIVRLLDEFDTLTSSLTEGLPREIELRRQQYAYYRDQLLSFPRG